MPWEESRIYLVRGSRVYMARVGTPMDGAMEERAECGEGSGIGRMVQREQGVVAEMVSAG